MDPSDKSPHGGLGPGRGRSGGPLVAVGQLHGTGHAPLAGAGLARKVAAEKDPARRQATKRQLRRAEPIIGSAHAASLGRRMSPGHEQGPVVPVAAVPVIPSETCEMLWRQADVW